MPGGAHLKGHQNQQSVDVEICPEISLHMKCTVCIHMWLSMEEVAWHQTKPETIQSDIWSLSKCLTGSNFSRNKYLTICSNVVFSRHRI